jgi:hypothetical protein
MEYEIGHVGRMMGLHDGDPIYSCIECAVTLTGNAGLSC